MSFFIFLTKKNIKNLDYTINFMKLKDKSREPPDFNDRRLFFQLLL